MVQTRRGGSFRATRTYAEVRIVAIIKAIKMRTIFGALCATIGFPHLSLVVVDVVVVAAAGSLYMALLHEAPTRAPTYKRIRACGSIFAGVGEIASRAARDKLGVCKQKCFFFAPNEFYALVEWVVGFKVFVYVLSIECQRKIMVRYIVEKICLHRDALIFNIKNRKSNSQTT